MKFFALAFLAIILASCGDSDSSGSGSSARISGTFVDDPVAGLKYVTSGNTNYTDSDGSFECRDGNSVEFYVGNLLIGSATCGSVITPLDIRDTTDHTDNSVLNVALILQNLDDGSTTNVLTIPEAYHEEDFSSLDLTEAVDATFVAAFDAIANIPAATVTTKAAAQTTLLNGIGTKFNGRSISFSLTTNDDCDAMDDIAVTGSFKIDTTGGANNWTLGSGTLKINESEFPLEEKSVSSSGLSSLTFTNDLLDFYQDPTTSPNDNLSTGGWLCGNDTVAGGLLTAFDAEMNFEFEDSNSGTVTLKEKATCSGTPRTTTCGSGTFKVN